ncbi:MAG: metallophosphoesterase family protein [Nitriliruptorales bacterium]|nr:metallophosphoesterase family protein [Nitriliruptorales bacterium]
MAYGTFIEREWYRLRHVHVPDVLRDPTAGPLRLLHVSDTHLDPPDERKRRFLERVATSDYDLVVATGDLLGASGAEPYAGEALACLTDGRPGVAILGSNDHWAPAFKSPLHYFRHTDERIHGEALDVDVLVDGLAAAGFETLTTGVSRIAAGGRVIAIGTIDDPHMPENTIPSADRLRQADDAVLRLGLVHAPYRAALDILVDSGHDLVLAGHTHGGQVRLPGIGALVANCDLPLRQVRGLSRHRGAWLHVSPGIGTSRYAPFRFACRPEATILHLT